MEAYVPPPRVRRKPTVGIAGFSLVEICLALGIVAFALVPLVGLLAVGLDSYHNASLRGRSAQVVSQIASCIRLASPVTDPTTGKPTDLYTAAPRLDNGSVVTVPPGGMTLDATRPPMQWKLDSGNWLYTIYFDENGEVTTLNSTGTGWNPPQMVAMVVLTPPTTKFDAGKAQIAVAWPAVRAPTYSATSGITFANPQGHDESTISFVTSSP